ncbi:hypothetical protein RHECNPAF_14110024 [Rhizobium etli CNPAF512]|nr:hypothetical protein RHECNPAF_14110024 [Rhizobium etli CNPAF512]
MLLVLSNVRGAFDERCGGKERSDDESLSLKSLEG